MYAMSLYATDPGDSGGPYELPPIPYNCTEGLDQTCGAPCTWDPNTEQCVPPPPPPWQIRAVHLGTNKLGNSLGVRTDTSAANAWITGQM